MQMKAYILYIVSYIERKFLFMLLNDVEFVSDMQIEVLYV